MRVKQICGVMLMAAGLVPFLASFCDTWLAIGDYFTITELWGVTCPDRFHSKALLIAGVMIAVLGQRLYSGRDLKTGKKPGAED